MRRLRRLAPVLFGSLVGTALAADSPHNQLANADFEMGRAGWTFQQQSPHWIDFTVEQGKTHSGQRAVRLHLTTESGKAAPPARISGVVQEIRPEVFPERVGGWYFVERFEKSSPETDLYLQFVAIVWDDPRTPRLVDPQRPNPLLTNYQIRYYLAGLEEPAFLLANARMRFVERRARPKLGEWVHFEVPLHADFEDLWGGVPSDYSRLRLLFEARWDNLAPDSRVDATVWFDDLYALPPGR